MHNIVVSQEQKIKALSRISYFSGLSMPALKELAEGTWLRRYNRDEVLFWEGEACAGLYIIQSGSVKLFKTSLQGRELIINVFEDGASFNEVPVFDQGKNPVNVAALEDCEVWLVEASVIHQVLMTHPEMCEAVIANLTANLRMLVEKVEELSFYQVTNRLARLINQLPREQLSGQASQRITQDQLAARLGTVREVVARSLRELERSGAIRVKRRLIEVTDEQMLEDWAQCPDN